MQLSQTVLIQTIHFSISIDFHLTVKIVLYQTIQFSISSFSKLKTILFQAVQFSISTRFNCQKYFYFKLFSLVKQFEFKQFSLVLFNP